jgi:hypothetical protein
LRAPLKWHLAKQDSALVAGIDGTAQRGKFFFEILGLNAVENKSHAAK